jgi:hypothetical protein
LVVAARAKWWGRPAAAIEAYTRGIATAERRGDKQAAKEMTVYLRRLQKDEGAS